MANPLDRHPCDDAWLEIDGALLRYRLEGHGSPLVLIHELGGSLESWDAIVPGLARHHTVIRYDQRGAGGSEKIVAPFSISDLAHDLGALLTALNITEPVHLVGAAFGAAQAVAYAVHNTASVGSVALLAPALDMPSTARQLVLDRAQRAAEHGMRAIETASLDRAWPTERRKGSPVFDEYRKRYLCSDSRAFALHNRALADVDLCSVLGELTCPTLVVAGSHDAVRPPHRIRAYLRALVTARYAEVDASHFMAVEAPEMIGPLLREFLADTEIAPTLRPRLVDPSDSDLSDAQKNAVAEAVAGARGRVPAPMRAWLASPEFARRAQALGEVLRFNSSLSPRLSELAIIMTARIWQSEYEWRVHSAAAAEAGLAEAVIEEVRIGQRPKQLLDDERIVFDVGLALRRDGYLSDELFARAEHGLGRAGLAELIGIFGYYTLVSMTLNTYEIGTSGEITDAFTLKRQ